MSYDSGSQRRGDTLSDELLLRSQGMTNAAYEELFTQTRLVVRGRREEVGPSLFVDAAESNPVFRGLNHTRDLLPAVEKAVAEIAKNPKAAATGYDTAVKKVREAQRAAAEAKASEQEG